MKNLKQSTQYKKDLKRYLNQPSKLLALQAVTESLRETGSVPVEYGPHKLRGSHMREALRPLFFLPGTTCF